MTKFKKYINQIENQDFKEFTKYLDEDELIKLEYHFDNYAKQLTIHSVVDTSVCDECNGTGYEIDNNNNVGEDCRKCG